MSKVESGNNYKKIGDRLGIIIPHSAILNANLHEGDVLEFFIEGHNLMITLDKNARACIKQAKQIDSSHTRV